MKIASIFTQIIGLITAVGSPFNISATRSVTRFPRLNTSISSTNKSSILFATSLPYDTRLIGWNIDKNNTEISFQSQQTKWNTPPKWNIRPKRSTYKKYNHHQGHHHLHSTRKKSRQNLATMAQFSHSHPLSSRHQQKETPYFIRQDNHQKQRRIPHVGGQIRVPFDITFSNRAILLSQRFDPTKIDTLLQKKISERLTKNPELSGEETLEARNKLDIFRGLLNVDLRRSIFINSGDRNRKKISPSTILKAYTKNVLSLNLTDVEKLDAFQYIEEKARGLYQKNSRIKDTHSYIDILITTISEIKIISQQGKFLSLSTIKDVIDNIEKYISKFSNNLTSYDATIFKSNIELFRDFALNLEKFDNLAHDGIIRSIFMDNAHSSKTYSYLDLTIDALTGWMLKLFLLKNERLAAFKNLVDSEILVEGKIFKIKGRPVFLHKAVATHFYLLEACLQQIPNLKLSKILQLNAFQYIGNKAAGLYNEKKTLEHARAYTSVLKNLIPDIQKFIQDKKLLPIDIQYIRQYLKDCEMLISSQQADYHFDKQLNTNIVLIKDLAFNLNLQLHIKELNSEPYSRVSEHARRLTREIFLYRPKHNRAATFKLFMKMLLSLTSLRRTKVLKECTQWVVVDTYLYNKHYYYRSYQLWVKKWQQADPEANYVLRNIFWKYNSDSKRLGEIKK